MKAADNQEKVQMMGFRVQFEMQKWCDAHPGQSLPAAGSRQFRNEILSVAIKEHELKEGVANFLFTQDENLRLVQNLWQLEYFQVTGAIPLKRLDKALGRANKKDLSKKSASATVRNLLSMRYSRLTLTFAPRILIVDSCGGG